jgi:hypothetical protein
MNSKGVFYHLMAGVLVALGCGTAAQAGFVLDINQVGADVVGTGSGTIDLADLTSLGSTNGGGLIWGNPTPDSSGIGLGGVVPQAVDGWIGTVTGSTAIFATGGLLEADSGSGDAVDIIPLYDSPQGAIFVPTGYVSGSALSDTSTWDNTTIAALGLIPGTYTYNWGSGADADFFTINIGQSTPEPGTAWLLAGGFALFIFARRLRARIN